MSDTDRCSWFFSWNGGRSTLELHNRTRDYAYHLATECGWRPKKWYSPSTWGNFVIKE